MEKKHKPQVCKVKERTATYCKTGGEIQLPPKEYWEDEKWLNKNGTKLTKHYPNMWIAVVDKKVVAYGENPREVINKAKEIAGHEHFPIHFVERGMHVYLLLVLKTS